MAVVPKHKDAGNRYDPNQELTSDQLHRFGQVAQRAQERREERIERGVTPVDPRIAKRAALKDAAFKPVIRTKRDKPNTARYAIWMLVFMAFMLWLMYMTR
ncbi:hypothetical protein F0231_01025 [Vibrio sp. RE86]|uniref:hypothetical protein n=1 Tax=Vibrio sp. RE86 TaxID=2607605 RepID=UPI00149332A8|nr:hypothetical protein [Vibrio sp. RE86]NOH78317.1 hypothetical protein [Vibrio sp. RE86]